MKTEIEYLAHILESINAIQEYVSRGRESLDDLKTQDAVIRRLQVMAESCLRLSNETMETYPDVGWQHIRNFRNRLVHEYLDVDINLIWVIIEHNLPPLKSAVENLLANTSDDG